MLTLVAVAATAFTLPARPVSSLTSRPRMASVDESRHWSVKDRQQPHATSFGMVPDDDLLTPRQQARDKTLAEKDTRAWCLDRCLASGFCDAVEDLWEMSTAQVMQFCESCSDGEECVLPETHGEWNDDLDQIPLGLAAYG